MQLKLRRSQREAGMLSTNVIFCLDARVDFTREEQQSITRYKLANQVIYNSEASRRLLEKSVAQQDGSLKGNLKAVASAALAALKLNISIASLQRGQHIECKSLDELLGAEDAIMTACHNLRGYLDTAASFDGREVLVDFSDHEPKIVAQAVSPNPQLVAPRPSRPLPPAPQPVALAPPTEDAEFHDVGEMEANWESFAATRPDRELGLLDGLPFDIHDPKTQQNAIIIGVVVLACVAWLAGH